MKNLITLFAACLIPITIAAGEDTPVYQWSKRLELTPEQQQLLRLYNDMEDSHDPVEQSGVAESVKSLAAKLGADAVRPAKPGEITVTRMGKTELFAVHNPSKDNVALTIAMRGDEQQIGSAIGSIGRLTYLPPSGTLIVPKLYWTTPRTDQK
jgi:hypothetical protein